ncbi:MAG: transcription antitermination factor NusB [Micrococcaceae bacterium]
MSKSQVSHSRLAAYEVLAQVSEEDAYANLALQKVLNRKNLSDEDAAFTTELVNGAIRNQFFYENILKQVIDRPLDRVDEKVLNVLYLGIHQLLGMRVSDYAALDQSVSLAKKVAGVSTGSFLNAILRNVSSKGRSEWLDEILRTKSDPLERLAIEYSHPTWIVRSLKQSLIINGRSTEELPDLLEADNLAPIVNLVALDGLGDIEEAYAKGADISELVENAALWKQGNLRKLEGIRNNTIRVQDVGSQLIARALAELEISGNDERWLDLCAGPGGKAALLGALAAKHNAKLVANEVQKHRADLVKSALRPLPKKSFEIRVDDGRNYGKNRPDFYDKVLVDAPCTGLGALRRRPEARWRKQLSDIATLVPLQQELLESAYKAIRLGGVVAYVTCSPHIAETQGIVDQFFSKHADAELLDTITAIKDVAESVLTENPPSSFEQKFLPANTEGTTAQLWPDVHKTDAMFCAFIRKGNK